MTSFARLMTQTARRLERDIQRHYRAAIGKLKLQPKQKLAVSFDDYVDLRRTHDLDLLDPADRGPGVERGD
jgi:hypothetical protein